MLSRLVESLTMCGSPSDTDDWTMVAFAGPGDGAGAPLQAAAAAASAGTSTLLAAGLPLERPVCDVRLMLAAQKEQRNLQRGAGVRAADDRAKGGKAGRAGAAIAQKELAMKAELAGRREQLLPNAVVQVLGRAHPGVTIQIGVRTLLLDEQITATKFSWDPQKREIRREKQSR